MLRINKGFPKSFTLYICVSSLFASSAPFFVNDRPKVLSLNVFVIVTSLPILLAHMHGSAYDLLYSKSL